jgi:hypothetical protein
MTPSSLGIDAVRVTHFMRGAKVEAIRQCESPVVFQGNSLVFMLRITEESRIKHMRKQTLLSVETALEIWS